MMFLNLLIYLILAAYIIRTIRNALYIIFLWQVKEYRWDRMLAHFKTPLGKKFLLNPLSLAKTFLFLLIFISIIIFALERNPQLDSLPVIFMVIGGSLALFWLIWVLEALLNIKELLTRGWLAPQFTLKVFIILVVVLVFEFPYLIAGRIAVSQLILGILTDRMLNPLIGFLVLVSNIPAVFYKKWIIGKAKKKILQFKNLTVIGITGSYGKTSTKEFLATILGEKFKVAKTPGFNNTDIGVAKYVLTQLKPDCEIFVVEMGAYKRGEIKAICEIVHPKIGIITGINQQHLELFGSLTNTMKTKFELIESLKQEGTALFNGDNKYCLEMSQWAKKRKLTTLVYRIDQYIDDSKIFKDHIEFIFRLDNKNYKMRANLLGQQNMENLLAAILVAKESRLSLKEITRGVSNIASPPQTMKLYQGPHGITLVDDTFNANLNGVTAAVDYMKAFSGKKILVLTPLIELGTEAEKLHELLGEKVTQICDLILLTNINYNKSFIAGARQAHGEEKVQIVNTAVGVKLIRKNLDHDGVAVFEGKEAKRILERLLKSN